MRYIVLPQAFKIVIPPLGNQFINLVKNSSILAIVAGLDLMYQGDLIASETFNTFDTYIIVGLFYLVITLPLSYLMVYLEKNGRFVHRRRGNTWILAALFHWMNVRFLLEGLKVTVEVSLFSIIFSFLIGGLTGVIRFANIPFLSKILGIVIDIIRNLPLLLIIFFTYFALPQIGIQMNIFWSAVAALTIFESAMLSEIFRAGLNAVPKADGGRIVNGTDLCRNDADDRFAASIQIDDPGNCEPIDFTDQRYIISSNHFFT